MLLNSFLIAAVSLVPGITASTGCFAALPAGLTPGGPSQNITIASKSVIGNITQRQFLLHLPQNFAAKNDKPAPLILAFHGQLQPAWSMESVTEMSKPAFNKDYVVVYPQGLDVQAPGWLSDPLAPPSSVLDDRIFANEILDHLASHFCIDESRIYATGVSNGGGLTALLACDPKFNRCIAAFGLVAAATYPDSSLTEPLFGKGCNPSIATGRHVPILEFHGLNDSVIAYNGDNGADPASIPVTDFMQSWVTRNRCSSVTPVVRSLQGKTVTETRWTCDGKADVVVHRAIAGFGHGWPSVASQANVLEQLRLGPTKWNASSVILEWFGKFKL
ncbi:carbohydrate esterase family 1 protein [Plenodomus tracheiphilus IPT5]|uniref:feruloyl esterase n=1 Tax=Plenodomus tracheiphilus IPT5 TaxID=1408161 RepID=A0A6A7AXN4_9PLEO|nr:carbohydrate esterase family 1 protein [Plenodomus tracheiphilus IPT5]